jgi:GNAT superfamily N-acetyltransferase
MSTITIRPAIPADIPTLLRLIVELATYERAADAVVATQSQLHDSLFGPDAVARAILAEDAGNPVGYAVYFFNFSTWLGKPGVYLEDLYVAPEARGAGIGRRLLGYLAKIAIERGCGRFEWWVLNWNESAIRFYQSVGAVPMDDWTVYRLTGDALTRLSMSET